MIPEIISYKDEYQPAFKAINLVWLDKYHLTETHDLLVLDDPQKNIIQRGGFIWLAKAGDEIIGSAALMKEHEGEYELAKMCVKENWQGRGISKLLIETCIAKAKQIGAHKLSLFSNHQLQMAIGLYEKYGFKHVELVNSPFETADVKMELVY